MAHFLEQVAEARFHERPWALVLGLLLDPLHRGVSVASKRFLDRTEGEGGNLLNSNDSDVLDSTLSPLGLEIVEDLSTAKDDLFDLGVGDHILSLLFNDSLEPETCLELAKFRASSTELQEFLGDGHY